MRTATDLNGKTKFETKNRRTEFLRQRVRMIELPAELNFRQPADGRRHRAADQRPTEDLRDVTRHGELEMSDLNATRRKSKNVEEISSIEPDGERIVEVLRGDGEIRCSAICIECELDILRSGTCTTS